jgi:uncharacterized protein (TIGR03083 family)
MPTSLTFEEHGEGLGDAWTVLRDNAARAGLGAAVPTCPGWTVRELVAHQGMVHRWAAGCVRGEGDDEACDGIEQEGLASPDLLAWLDEGAKDLLAALAFAPAELDTWFFLPDSAGPREGWARRQCHETTIHAVDALAARLGRVPRADETWIRAAIALDGVDELLTGFVPRPRQRVHRSPATRLLVAPRSTTRAWLLDIAPDRPPVVERLDLHEGSSVPEHDALVTGEPVEVLLRLWSRGGEPGDEIERWWTDTVSVTW